MQHRALPVVDGIYVDGRRIPIFCQRDYLLAKQSYWSAVDRSLLLILPENSATKQVSANTKREAVAHG